MASRPYLRRRSTTPVRSTERSGTGQSLPSDVLLQTCRRLRILGLASALLWTLALVMNNLVARVVGTITIISELWPMPGNAIAAVGLAVSGLLAYVAGRLSSKPSLLIEISSGFLVVTCL